MCFQEKKLADKLNKAQKDFRKFFLSLIASEKLKQNYFARDYEKEFGADFHDRLKLITCNFLQRIEQQLPNTEIDQVRAFIRALEPSLFLGV